MTERDFVREFQAAAGGQAVGDAGDFQAGAREAFGEVMAGGVAFHVGAEGDDDFLDGLVLQALFQFGDAEVLGLDAVERRNLSAENVVFAVEGRGLFHAKDVSGVLDEADQAGVAARVGANGAGVSLGQGAADGAVADAFARLDEELGELFRFVRVALDEMQRQAFRGARADAGQLVQGGDELGDGIGEGHVRRGFLTMDGLGLLCQPGFPGRHKMAKKAGKRNRIFQAEEKRHVCSRLMPSIVLIFEKPSGMTPGIRFRAAQEPYV